MALKDNAVVGFAETKIVDKSAVDVWELGAEVMESLLQTTGFEKGEIDGLILSSSMTGAGNAFWSQTTADYLGLELDFSQTVDIGGCSPLGALARGCAAIDAGLATTILLLYADTQVAENNSRGRGFQGEWIAPNGLLGPPGAFGLLTRRYEHLYGLDYTALAKIAVTQRGHALLNDNACEKLRKPMTIDDYMNSRMVSEPVRLLDCVMPTDGASGLLLTSRKRAKEKGIKKFVVPLGYGERTNFRWSEAVVDITESGHSVAGKKAFAGAGVGPADIGSFHPYDDFIIANMLQMEMLGFCKRGQGPAFVKETDFTYQGDLPLNTSGGQISAGQPGLAGGGVNVVECVRQLMGEGGKRQVKNTKYGLVTGIGGIPYGRNWATSNVMILTPDA
jgi:acetyl-CoA acetyltransferase